MEGHIILHFFEMEVTFLECEQLGLHIAVQTRLYECAYHVVNILVSTGIALSNASEGDIAVIGSGTEPLFFSMPIIPGYRISIISPQMPNLQGILSQFSGNVIPLLLASSSSFWKVSQFSHVNDAC